MFRVDHPDRTLARTKARLQRHGVTRLVLFANAFDWASLRLQQSLLAVLGLTLVIAVMGRLSLTLPQILLLLPLAHLIALQPLRHAVTATRRQLEMHRKALAVWVAPIASDVEREG